MYRGDPKSKSGGDVVSFPTDKKCYLRNDTYFMTLLTLFILIFFLGYMVSIGVVEQLLEKCGYSLQHSASTSKSLFIIFINCPYK